MRCRLTWLFSLMLVAGGSVAMAEPPQEIVRTSWGTPPPTSSAATTTKLDLDEVAPSWRDRVHKVISQPTMHATGPMETFNCNPLTYHWLLDHPCETAHMWRKLGAECADINPHGQDRFSWKDSNGSEMVWNTVVRNSSRRVWYAEGTVKPGPLLPAVAVKAVLVMHIVEGTTNKERPAVRHHTEIVIQTDSRAASMASKLLKGSAPKMAEQYLGQIEMFFAALAWYLDEFPDKANELCGNYRDCPR